MVTRAGRDPLPPDLETVRPAFEPVGIKRISVRVGDVARAETCYRQVFGAVPIELRTYDRVTIAVRNFPPAEARRTLRRLGLKPYGAGNEVLLRDPDGNEIALAAPSK
jgi:hypothetical protein